MKNYTKVQLIWLVIVRVLLGWYFLYEGVAKIFNPNWSSYGFLMDSAGWMKGLFTSLASNSGTVKVIDFLNTWGLIAIGLGLILGFLTRIAIIAAIVLLSMYFLSHPPLIDVEYATTGVDNTLWVDKNLIFIGTLVLLLIFPSNQVGIDRFVFKKYRI